MSSNDPDSCVPKAITDFVFDLYDSVTTSRIPEEQTKLYVIDFHELNAKYYGSSSNSTGGAAAAAASGAAAAGSSSTTSFWPSPQAMAGECNGDPLFLALYRELTHRQWHAVSRPTLRDRCEGWHVYRELFEEILELEHFYIVPTWCFDILNEFVYQFQGFCQVRSAVYASAKKFGLWKPGDETTTTTTSTTAAADGAAPSNNTNTTPSAALLENWNALQPGSAASDAWDVEAVFGYLNKLVQLGNNNSSSDRPVVYKYLSLFATVALSRLECLLGDYSACLRAIQVPIVEQASTVVEGDTITVKDVLHSVLSARVSVAYHTGVSYLMLRRYKDAMATLGEMCAGFPHLVAMAASAAGGSGTVVVNSRSNYRDNKQQQQQDSSHTVAAQLQSQLMKQHDRMISLLVVLTQLTPNSIMTISDDATRRAIRDKLSRGESAAAAATSGGGASASSGSLEEYFASPKFISVHGGLGTASAAPAVVPFHRHQTNLFNREAQLQNPYKTLRSYLKLYTSLPIGKLATFYDQAVEQVLPLLLSYKTKMRQLETTSSRGGGSGGEASGAEAVTAAAATESGGASSTSSYKTAMDIHYYIVDSMCHIDEPEKQRRFETHFFRQLAHAAHVARQAAAIDVRL